VLAVQAPRQSRPCIPTSISGSAPDHVNELRADIANYYGLATNTMIHIDEAYINYAKPAAIETALPLVLEFENVFITRSFSKAHGLAGLRVGYAL
jgi:histidinol-phosphate/aromatic aminotransferase/cobyric acid decarboxylase-like protein